MDRRGRLARAERGDVLGPRRVAFGLDDGTLLVLQCSSAGLAASGWPKFGGALGNGPVGESLSLRERVGVRGTRWRFRRPVPTLGQLPLTPTLSRRERGILTRIFARVQIYSGVAQRRSAAAW